jgi:hypothetical protein
MLHLHNLLKYWFFLKINIICYITKVVSIPQNEGEDWAAKAKAWAAANSTTGRPSDHSYIQQNEVTRANEETPLASSQNINARAGGGFAIAVADSTTLVSPAKNYNSFSAVYEQEVPSYSSSQGNFHRWIRLVITVKLF